MGYYPWYLAKIGKFCHFPKLIRILMVPFERSLSKLSENQKIVEIGSTKFKNGLTERVPKPLITQGQWVSLLPIFFKVHCNLCLIIETVLCDAPPTCDTSLRGTSKAGLLSTRKDMSDPLNDVSPQFQPRAHSST